MAAPSLPMAQLVGLGLALVRGEFYTLLGPVGAGKSAVIAMLAGFAPAAGQEVLLDGRPIGRTPPHRRSIGLVEPGGALLPHLNVAENIALPLRLRGVAKAARQARVAQMLDLLRLAPLAAHKPARLSPEQALRTALARALAPEPKLLLLDDPLTVLDRPAQATMQLELRRLHATLGLTILHATGNPAEALLLADRVGVLAGGRLLQQGPPQVLYDEPDSAQVAALLGETNLLAGKFIAQDDDLAEIRLDCGITVQALPIGAVPGQGCVVAVRPERIALATIAAEEMGDGALPATVQDVLPQGDHVRLRLIVGAPGSPANLLEVRRPAGAPMAGLRPGASASVAWQPYHARAFLPDRAAVR